MSARSARYNAAALAALEGTDVNSMPNTGKPSIVLPLLVFVVTLSILSVLVILELVYVQKTQNSLTNSDLVGAKHNFNISRGFIYTFAVIMLLGALGNSYQAAQETRVAQTAYEADRNGISKAESSALYGF